MKNVRTMILGAVACVGIAATAGAAPLQISAVTGDWASVLPVGTATVANGAGTDTVRWGTPFGQPNQSGYDFTPTASTTTPTLGVAFALGQFIHHNNPVTGDTPTDLSYDFSFGIPSATPATIAGTILFNHNETTNSLPCTDSPASVIPCDDVVKITTPLVNQAFTFEGISYVFNLLGFSTDGTTYLSSPTFFSPEGQDNMTTLYGIVTTDALPPPETPEPASFVLLGTGLLAAASRMRRKKTSES